MTEELLSNLKDASRVQVWSLCTPQAQDMYRKAGAKNKLRYWTMQGWKATKEIKHQHFFTTYKIDADFEIEPEPPYVDLPMVAREGVLKAFLTDFPRYYSQNGWCARSRLVDLKEFGGFFKAASGIRIDTEDVAACHRNGEQIVVRLWRETSP